MDETVKVACVQAEPVAFDRAATIEKVDRLAGEVADNNARLALFPEAFIPVYPSNRWVRFLAGWADAPMGTFARLASESITVPGPDSDRVGQIARTASGLPSGRTSSSAEGSTTRCSCTPRRGSSRSTTVS